jgi:hypothetical protein
MIFNLFFILVSLWAKLSRVEDIADPTYVARQYRDASNLSARIRLHQEFSTNKYGYLLVDYILSGRIVLTSDQQLNLAKLVEQELKINDGMFYITKDSGVFELSGIL